VSQPFKSIFSKTQILERQIDDFLDQIVEGAMYFEMGMRFYLDSDCAADICLEKLDQVLQVKSRCQELRRSIVTTLYAELLIPDMRGDLLSLMSDLYYLVDVIGDAFQATVVEQPQGLSTYGADVKALVEVAVRSVRSIVLAVRAFFRDPSAVRDRIFEVRLYEEEADKISLRLKQAIFQSELPLDHKMQLRDSINTLDQLADEAELVSDELSIYAIKHAL
jgi:uncharacterized protein Yka (UPF0111/DUF47 family)